mmetsp:Transcript_3147/g.11015  ORF Transcript_3147/g.11015 Transcript_3147/m.11015 type:complete len:98 (+) Transcript_3147:792-1085(+)
MVSDEEGDKDFAIPAGHCWVAADEDGAEEAAGPAGAASAAFGPLSAKHVIGRVLYSWRGPADHGPVENSEHAADQDAAVLECELDVAELRRAAEGGA